MFARKPLARLGLPVLSVALLALVLGNLGARTRGPATTAQTLYPDHFPPGPGDDIAARSCVICHSAMLVTQQAKDSLGWEKTLVLMEKWGAPLSPSERDSLRTYLMTNFGAKPASR